MSPVPASRKKSSGREVFPWGLAEDLLEHLDERARAAVTDGHTGGDDGVAGREKFDGVESFGASDPSSETEACLVDEQTLDRSGTRSTVLREVRDRRHVGQVGACFVRYVQRPMVGRENDLQRGLGQSGDLVEQHEGQAHVLRGRAEEHALGEGFEDQLSQKWRDLDDAARRREFGCEVGSQVDGSHVCLACCSNLMVELCRNPGGPLGRYDPGAVARVDRHHAFGRVDELVPGVGMGADMVSGRHSQPE